MKHKNLWLITMVMSSILLIAASSVQAADETITDTLDDVSSIDYITGETIVVTSSPEITVDNLDIVKTTYTKVGTQATLTLQVQGIIEDRGKIIDPYGGDDFDDFDFNAVEYGFQLITSEDEYMVSYSNKTGQLTSGMEQKNLTSSDFSVAGDTLTITFTLGSSDELYESLSVTSTFIKANFSSIETGGLTYLSDIAPNPELEIIEAYAPNLGSIGEAIQFNGSVQPLTGQPPYRYVWDFGDDSTSTLLNPTHIYTTAGTYTYTFTVIDQSEDSVSETGTITISAEGGSTDESSSPMYLFVILLVIIIVVGILVIVWIIRR
ncbi:MAG: PKD domain-containing protein [Candidatus Thermoplasmatota archaeon]|nr:PKD domain-containing protein [Candidatus Thermoplasmatota archaeon]